MRLQNSASTAELDEELELDELDDTQRQTMLGWLVCVVTILW